VAVYFTQREIVVPGQLLAKGPYQLGSNVYKVGNAIYSSIIGLAELKDRAIHVIPLKCCYVPKVGDIVIGKVIDVGISHWTVDIASPYSAILQVSDAFNKVIDTTREDLTKYFDVGDFLVAKIIAFDRTRDPLLSTKEPKCGKIDRGTVVEISPAKIPRLIGKKGSMINMIKKEINCQILVGQNGRIWIYAENPEDELLLVRVIKRIELEAHTSGLTDRIREMIRREKSRRGNVVSASKKGRKAS